MCTYTSYYRYHTYYRHLYMCMHVYIYSIYIYTYICICTYICGLLAASSCSAATWVRALPGRLQHSEAELARTSFRDLVSSTYRMAIRNTCLRVAYRVCRVSISGSTTLDRGTWNLRVCEVSGHHHQSHT